MRLIVYLAIAWPVLICGALKTSLEFGVRSISSHKPDGFSILITNEGYDCLKQVKFQFNATIDTTYTPEQEKQVLLDMYYFANGHNWYNQTGWNSPNQTSHCDWYGITCHNNTNYTKSIVVAYNNLQGPLPTNLWKLRNLVSLCVPVNPKLSGRIGECVYGNMSQLRIIILNGASITGSIPEDFVNLSYLERFFACPMIRGGLTGHLPHNLGNMTQLRMLCLEGNTFTGRIPRSISLLKKLFYLDLRNPPGKLWGHLEDLLSISSLLWLAVSGVKMKGSLTKIPPKMSHFVLTGNEIKGNLPPLDKFPKHIIVFDVSNNKLTGDVPGQLFFSITGQLVLSQNLFKSVNNGSSWPSKSPSKISLQYISLAENRNLSIDFDSFIRDCLLGGAFSSDTVTMLNMSFCDLQGNIAGELLTRFGSLIVCDLRNNRFNGSIPEVGLDNAYMTYLDLSGNKLSGDLPLGISGLTSLQYLDISGNPKMRQSQGNNANNLLLFDFSTMTKPKREANYTCAEGRLIFNNGRVKLDPTFYDHRYCICDSGFYGDSGLCKECMPGGTCQKPIVLSSSELKASTMKMHAGCWPSPSTSKATHLVPCPVPKACNPSGDCTCNLQTSNNLTSYSAVNSKVSFISTSCNMSCVCHHGNTDRFCSRCQRGFYKAGGLCFPCPKPKENITFYICLVVFAVTVLVMLFALFYFRESPKKAFIIVVVEFVLLFVFTLLELTPAWIFKLNVVVLALFKTNRGKGANSLIKIGIFYIQTLDSMVSTFNVWPRQVFAAQHYISSFWNLRFASLSCEFSVLFDPVGRFAFILLLPLLCLTSVGLYFLSYIAYKKLWLQEDGFNLTILFKCRQLTMSCLSSVYYPIVGATVSVLRPCDDDKGVRFMPKTPWIDCSSATYQILTTMGWVSVVIYIIGYPAMLFILMKIFYKKRDFMNGKEKENLDSWLGSVYLPFKQEYQAYFEFVLVLRRLLLAVSLSVLASMKSTQALAVSLILIISAMIQLRLQPYDSTRNNVNCCARRMRHNNEIDSDHDNDHNSDNVHNNDNDYDADSDHNYDHNNDNDHDVDVDSDHDNDHNNDNNNININIRNFENVFEFLVLFVLSVSFIALRLAALDSLFGAPVVWLVMVINGCVLIVLVSCILYHVFGLNPTRCFRRLYAWFDQRFRLRDNRLLQNPVEVHEEIQ